jgi:hypothetical protein
MTTLGLGEADDADVVRWARAGAASPAATKPAAKATKRKTGGAAPKKKASRRA